jgi:N-dimethylarginine dimethylaminohydrolase
MCPPEFYGIEYEINPWMSRSRQADRDRAQEQWNALRALLEQLGVEVLLMDPVPNLPDLVFTANAAMIYQRTAVLSHFRHPQRQGEETHNDAWLAAHGFEVRKVPESVYFEGAGDALFCGDTLFAGYRFRSDAKGHQLIAETIDCRVIPLELVSSYYYHLDTCFCPLEDGTAIWHPEAFDAYGQRVMNELVPRLIEVREDEAQKFACNAVVVGRHVVTNTGCPVLHDQLRAADFEPHETPLDEFVKAGGSAKCLTLRLDGEEAAAWRATK